MKYELHVYSLRWDKYSARTERDVETFYFNDLAKAKAQARRYFLRDGVYKCKVWNKGKAVPNTQTPDLLYELV